MPLSAIQKEVLALLAGNRSDESHLAGASGILMAERSPRRSHDLDLFHDRDEAVSEAFASDRSCLEQAGFDLRQIVSQPGFIRAVAEKGGDALRIDWAHDSAWRFMPTVELEGIGFVLHPVDLAINKVLALAGRDEARDLIDTLYIHHNLLPLGALVWGAVGKDPGMNPDMLLELLSRKGKLRQEDLHRLDLIDAADLPNLREQWLVALESARHFVAKRPPDEVGCLYLHPETGRFFAPDPSESATPHFPRPGGVMPTGIVSRESYLSELEGFFGRKAR